MVSFAPEPGTSSHIFRTIPVLSDSGLAWKAEKIQFRVKRTPVRRGKMSTFFISDSAFIAWLDPPRFLGT
jgi:hypothetical protein